MPSSIPATAAIARLPQLTVTQLRAHYQELFGEPTASRHKTWLVRRIAWRLQAEEEGGLSERALARAAQLAKDAEIRLTAPRVLSREEPTDSPLMKTILLPPPRSKGLAPGTVLRRTWRGRALVVTVLPNGFEHDGMIYRTLSAVANAITKSKWNGYVFFGLKKQGDAA